MKRSDAFIAIARIAYDVADKVDPETREEILEVALNMDERFCDARDEEANAE